MAEGVRCRVLGPIAVGRRGAERLTPLTGKSAHLVAALVASHPQPRTVESLIDALWDGAPTATAATGLRVLVSQLRTAFRADSDDDPIEFHAGAYRLLLADDVIDSRRFATLVDAARRALEDSVPDDAVVAAELALALWGGAAFGSVTGDDVIGAEGRRLDLLRLDAEDLLVEALLAAGDARRAATHAATLVDDQPLRELRWVRLMLALYRTGRQADTLRAYQRARHILADQLGLEPGPELRAMEQAILLQDPLLESGPTVAAASPADIGRFVRALRRTTGAELPPSPTSLVGRRRELSAVRELLAGHRLVSIVGPGGCGKTRLALALAEERVASATPAAVVFVALAAETTATIVTALADRLRVQPRHGEDLTDTLVAHLRASRTLVVLDNCEHLGDDVGELAQSLVDGCPDVTVLTTSRVPLGVDGECRFTLGPLAGEDAVALLIERASAVGSPPSRSGDLVERIVGSLDRLPLAIELAAGLLDGMSWAELDRTISKSRDALRAEHRTDGRHRDLVSAVGWSYDLLDTDTARCFEGLGVMAGSFLAADVAGILALDDVEAIMRMRELARSSLIVADTSGDVTRFHLLETMRWFARERLSLRLGDVERSHQRHFHWLLATCSTGLRGLDEAAAVDRLEPALDDVRMAFRRSVEVGDLDVASQFAVDAWEFGMMRLHGDLLDWSDTLLAVPGVEDVDDHARLLGVAAVVAWIRSDPGRARDLAHRAVRSANDRGQAVPMEVHHALLDVAGFEGRLDDAIGHLQAIADLSIELDDPYRLANTHVLATVGATLNGLTGVAAASAAAGAKVAERSGNPSTVAWTAYGSGFELLERDAVSATVSFERGAALARSVRSGWVLGWNLSGLATGLRRTGRHDEALAMLPELLVLWHRGNYRAQLQHVLIEVALDLRALGELDGAIMALSAADSIPLGFPPLPSDRGAVDDLRAVATSRPGQPVSIDEVVDVVGALVGQVAGSSTQPA